MHFIIDTIMNRDKFLTAINQAFAVNPVCVMLGPRQSGKSTFANMYASNQKMV